MEKYREKSSVKTIEDILIEQGIDPETGLRKEELLRVWDACKPTLKEGQYKGKIIVGTIGESDNSKEWKNIFMNPESYKILPFDNIWKEGSTDRLKGLFIPAFRNGEETKLTGKQYYEMNMELTKEQLEYARVKSIENINQVIQDLKNTGASVKDISDGYHSFDELYEFRKMYNAILFNEWAEDYYAAINPYKNLNITELHPEIRTMIKNMKTKYNVHKSWKHSDGEYCFGSEKEWFIVSAMLPTGLISNHYKAEDWDLFKIPEVEKALFEYDGHTGADVLERIKNLNK